MTSAPSGVKSTTLVDWNAAIDAIFEVAADAELLALMVAVYFS